METAVGSVIPECWRSALNLNYGCWTTLGALADWLSEQGLEVEEEAIRWAVEKGRKPDGDDSYKWAWGSNRKGGAIFFYELPLSLWERVRLLEPKIDTYTAYDRLIRGWLQGTEQERRKWWNWNPETD